MFETYLKWIEAHERLLLVGVGGLVLWFALGRIDTMIANHDKANLAQVQAAALVQAHKDEALASAAQQAAAQYQALADKVQAQNAELTQANVTLAAALTKQQKTDATLPPTELVARINTLVPAAQATVTSSGVGLPQSGAVAVAQQLEEVPVLSSQVANETQIANSNSTLLASSQTEVSTLNAEIDGLKTKATLDAKVCTDQIAVVKAEARKSKRRWFLIGYIAGFASRQAIKTYFGF